MREIEKGGGILSFCPTCEVWVGSRRPGGETKVVGAQAEYGESGKLKRRRQGENVGRWVRVVVDGARGSGERLRWEGERDARA